MVPEKFIQLSTLFDKAVRELDANIISYYEVNNFSFFQLASERPYDIALRCLLSFVDHRLFLVPLEGAAIRIDPKVFTGNRFRSDINMLYMPLSDDDAWSDLLKYNIPSYCVDNRLISWGVSPDSIKNIGSDADGYTEEYREKFFKSELSNRTFSQPNLFIKQPDFVFDFDLYDFLTKRSSNEARRKYSSSYIEEYSDFLRQYHGCFICTETDHVDKEWGSFWNQTRADPHLMMEFPIDYSLEKLHVRDENRKKIPKLAGRPITGKLFGQAFLDLGYKPDETYPPWKQIRRELNKKTGQTPSSSETVLKWAKKLYNTPIDD